MPSLVLHSEIWPFPIIWSRCVIKRSSGIRTSFTSSSSSGLRLSRKLAIRMGMDPAPMLPPVYIPPRYNIPPELLLGISENKRRKCIVMAVMLPSCCHPAFYIPWMVKVNVSLGVWRFMYSKHHFFCISWTRSVAMVVQDNSEHLQDSL